MRKLLVTVVASCALVAIMPATALAHGHHSRGHHHARVHHRTFGHDFNQSGSSTSGSTSSEPPAGTVQSFDSTTGVLTILLSDGKTTETGTVTPDTEIECQAPDMSDSSGGWQGHDQGGDNGGGDQGDDQGQGDDENNNDQNAQNCGTAALTTGAMVQEARLTISGAGATWDKIELVSSSASAVDNDNDGD